jgi:hypothetical protein
MICSGATTALKKSIKELDEVADEMTGAAITGVFNSMSSNYCNDLFRCHYSLEEKYKGAG